MSAHGSQPTYRELMEVRTQRRKRRLQAVLRWLVPVIGGVLLLAGVAAVGFGAMSHRSSLDAAHATIAAHEQDAQAAKAALDEKYAQSIKTFSNVSYEKTTADDEVVRDYIDEHYTARVPGLGKDVRLTGFKSYVVDDAGNDYKYFAHITVSDNEGSSQRALMTYTVHQGNVKDASLTWGK